MRVTMICAGLPTAENPSRGIFNWRAATLLKNHCTIEIIFLRMWKPFRKFRNTRTEDGIHIHEIGIPTFPFLPNLLNLWIAQRVGWLITKKNLRNTDILHSVSADFCSIVAGYWSEKSGKKHVAQLIGSDINSVLPEIKNKPVIRHWTKQLDGVVCNSKALNKAFSELYPEFMHPVVTIYRGTDIRKFSPLFQHTESKNISCLYVGGFTPYQHLPHQANTKGGYTVLELWKHYEHEFKTFNLHLHMAGPDTIDNADVIHWHKRLKYPELVKLSPILSQKEIIQTFQETDILLLPSKEEGLPNAGVEAAACGCVIIGNNVGGIPEIIEHEHTGLVIYDDHTSEWHKALIYLCCNDEKRKTMSVNARERILKDFNSDNYGKSLVSFYSSL